jgi:hypothetical protein
MLLYSLYLVPLFLILDRLLPNIHQIFLFYVLLSFYVFLYFLMYLLGSVMDLFDNIKEC